MMYRKVKRKPSWNDEIFTAHTSFKRFKKDALLQRKERYLISSGQIPLPPKIKQSRAIPPIIFRPKTSPVAHVMYSRTGFVNLKEVKEEFDKGKNVIIRHKDFIKPKKKKKRFPRKSPRIKSARFAERAKPPTRRTVHTSRISRT